MNLFVEERLHNQLWTRPCTKYDLHYGW